MITDSIVRAQTITSWLAAAEEQIKLQSDYLTQLDAAIGDGDHGTNMRRGMDAVGKAVAGQGDAPPGRLLILAGKTLVSTVEWREQTAVGLGAAARGPARSVTRNRLMVNARSRPRSTRGRSRGSSSSALRRPATRRWSTRWCRRRRRCTRRSTADNRWMRR